VPNKFLAKGLTPHLAEDPWLLAFFSLEQLPLSGVLEDQVPTYPGTSLPNLSPLTPQLPSPSPLTPPLPPPFRPRPPPPYPHSSLPTHSISPTHPNRCFFWNNPHTRPPVRAGGERWEFFDHPSLLISWFGASILGPSPSTAPHGRPFPNNHLKGLFHRSRAPPPPHSGVPLFPRCLLVRHNPLPLLNCRIRSPFPRPDVRCPPVSAPGPGACSGITRCVSLFQVV